MIENIGGAIIGINLALKKKFRIPIICGWFFTIILTIMAVSTFLDYKTFIDLKGKNIIVQAITYPVTRTSLNGNKYDTKYYEWIFEGKYYSSKIPSYDGFTEEENMGNSYEIYINSQNPSQFARVTNNNSLRATIGFIGFGLFFLLITIFLIYMQKKANRGTVLNGNNQKNITMLKELKKHSKIVSIVGNVLGGACLIYMLIDNSMLSVIVSISLILIFLIVFGIRYKKILKNS
jgi:hypothetical protein